MNDGATVNVTVSKMPVTLELGLVGDSDDECGWVIAVPNGVSLQRLFVPQEGNPLAITAMKIPLEIPAGEVEVTKTGTDGTQLPGTVFELLNSAGAVVKTATTNASGVARFTDVDPGNYTVREKTASTGYRLSAASSQGVTVTAGNTSKASFTNEEFTPKIRIEKRDQLIQVLWSQYRYH